MKFICTGKGFFKERVFNKETLTSENIFTDKVREARRFSSMTSAQSFLDKLNEPGFIWKPSEEESIKDMYEVVKGDGKLFDSANFYQVRSAKWLNTSDANFLNGYSRYDSTKHLPYEEAVKICNEKNQEIIQQATKALIVK